jgi:hypothetical protein
VSKWPQLKANSGWGVEQVQIEKQQFVASEPWDPDRPETLVVCCSDGRWHAQIHEFIHRQISARPDLYAVPGGPAGFSMWTSVFEEGKGLEKAFHFLATHHNLQSTWLIAHQNCAHYLTKYSGTRDAEFIYQRQLEDLEYARRTIVRWKPNLNVFKVFAALDQQKIVFSIIPSQSR